MKKEDNEKGNIKNNRKIPSPTTTAAAPVSVNSHLKNKRICLRELQFWPAKSADAKRV